MDIQTSWKLSPEEVNVVRSCLLPFKQEERPDPSRTCSGRSNLTNVRHTIIIKFSVSPF